MDAVGAVESGRTCMFCKSKYLLVRLPLELCSGCPRAVPGSKQRPIVWSGSWASQCLRMLLIEPTCLILVKTSLLAQTGVHCCLRPLNIYPVQKWSVNSLTQTLSLAKLYLLCYLTSYEGTSIFITKDQKFIIMIQEWSSVGSGEFACEMLGRFLWQESHGDKIQLFSSTWQDMAADWCCFQELCPVCNLSGVQIISFCWKERLVISDFVWCVWVGLCLCFVSSE